MAYDTLAGRRRKAMPGKTPAARSKIETVMHEFKSGSLHSGSGAQVRNRKQALAIALSEARKAARKR